MYYRVLVASQRFHGKESLTYESADLLEVGQIVGVHLQQKTVLGIIESKVPKPSFKTKPINLHWPLIIPTQSLKLLTWLQAYYPAPLGFITELFTPSSLPKKLPEPLEPKKTIKAVKLPPLTDEQKSILRSIDQAADRSILIHGDTGTGKTRVYMELAMRVLEQKQSVIILTPEIGLTEPLLQTLTNTFGGRVLITHSNMTPAARREVWIKASKSEEGVVIIGPRSALFSPLKNIGLIVIDEAHDSAYKQEQAPRYQTSRVAAQLAHLHDAQLVMGTATPLVHDYFTFKQKQLPLLKMSKPALKAQHPTTIDIIDHKDKDHFTRSPWLATKLLDGIETALNNKEQSLLFLNRRGSARLVLCNSCGWQAFCPHCDIPLTYHQDTHQMRCHSCDFAGTVPTNCPTCNKNELIFRSIGTKALEVEIQRLFPRAKVARFDRDTDKALKLSEQFNALQSGKVDIIIGTQTVAKGFDLPRLSLVGIIQADSGLQIPDYSATERSFQLISQVSGRIGRGHRAGKLFVQTFAPDSPLILWALGKDYDSFYEHELSQRQLYSFPPFVFVLKITCSRTSSKSALLACQKVADTIRSSGKKVVVEGPSPRFVEKIAGRYAWHLIVKAKNRTYLTDVIGELPSSCGYDLDPSDLL